MSEIMLLLEIMVETLTEYILRHVQIKPGDTFVVDQFDIRCYLNGVKLVNIHSIRYPSGGIKFEVYCKDEDFNSYVCDSGYLYMRKLNLTERLLYVK